MLANKDVVFVLEMGRGDMPSDDAANVANKYTISTTWYFLQVVFDRLDLASTQQLDPFGFFMALSRD